MIQRLLCAFSVALIAATLAACGGGTTATTTSNSSAVPFDRAFIDGMVPHHRLAIAMAAAAETAGLTAPDLKEIAANIADSQQREIDTMLRWRKAWYGSSKVDPNGADALGMSADEMGMGHSAHDFSEAADVDASFASMMIDHHEGAVAMAKLALERAARPEIRALAQEIVTAQQREIDVMQQHTAGGSMHRMEQE